MEAESPAQVERAVDLFSMTLRSLASDAVAIRQLTDFVHVADLLENAVTTGNDSSLSSPHIQQLRQMDAMISSAERKVAALRELVREETNALDKFETTLQQEANRQQSAVEKLSAAIADIQIKKKPPKQQKQQRLSMTKSRSSLLAATAAVHSNHNKQASSSSFEFRRITASELLQISKNTRGRLTMVALNEALKEIATVCQAKVRTAHEAALRTPRPTASTTSSSSTFKTAQRRYEYLRQQRDSHNFSSLNYHHHKEDEPYYNNNWVVSEQELRENCAFFRHGEATARATLVVLCAMKRLKQIPGRNSNMEVTYVCLFDNVK